MLQWQIGTQNGLGVTATCHHAEVQGSLPLSMMVESARYKGGLGIDKTWVHVSYISSLTSMVAQRWSCLTYLDGKKFEVAISQRMDPGTMC